MTTGTPPSGDAVVARGLAVRFGRGTRRTPFVDALRGVDLTCARGTIVGVLGPNGSGKTTLFRVLAGDLAPTCGEARVLGEAPFARDLVQRVGYQPEGPLPFPRLDAREFLRHVGALMRLERNVARGRAATWLERLGLDGVGRRAIQTFSTGMTKRLALCAALLADPEVLLLDEPTSGLDPLGSLLVLETLRARADAGATVLIASHQLEEVEQVCDRVCVLRSGAIVAEGSLDDLLGTGGDRLVVRGLDGAGRDAVAAAARDAGGSVEGWTTDRRHLFALFRDLDAAP